MTVVVVDADVLAAPVSRTLLLRASLDGGFSVRWSAHIESQAQRAIDRRARMAAPLASLHVLYPNALIQAPNAAMAVRDTHSADEPVLRLACAVGARFIVTRNVRDFGAEDRRQHSLAAVHVDLFLAVRLDTDAYRRLLRDYAASRTTGAITPGSVHAMIAAQHPLTFQRHRTAFQAPGEITLGSIPQHLYRGATCIRCGRRLTAPDSLASGLGPRCARAQ